MKRATLVELCLFAVLVVAGATLRIGLQDIPNFAPVAALALFAGFYFRSATAAAAVPLSIMALSDLVIGGYSWYMMALVYASLTFPVLLRPWVRKTFELRAGRPLSCLPSLAGLVTCSLLSSLLFFVVTNFGAWTWFDMYERSWSGLLECYVRAIPFFRYTLAGDASFAFVFFGGFAAYQAFAQAKVETSGLSVEV